MMPLMTAVDILGAANEQILFSCFFRNIFVSN